MPNESKSPHDANRAAYNDAFRQGVAESFGKGALSGGVAGHFGGPMAGLGVFSATYLNGLYDTQKEAAAAGERAQFNSNPAEGGLAPSIDQMTRDAATAAQERADFAAREAAFNQEWAETQRDMPAPEPLDESVYPLPDDATDSGPTATDIERFVAEIEAHDDGSPGFAEAAAEAYRAMAEAYSDPTDDPADPAAPSPDPRDPGRAPSDRPGDPTDAEIEALVEAAEAQDDGSDD